MSDPSDWEDWDPSQGNFLHHMVAGSIAGITEHTVMFPVDTLKTYVQCMHECPERVAGQRVLEMVRGQGMLRLWRGVGTMFTGCVPAHALYFSVFEYCKDNLGVNRPGHHPAGAAIAGACATIFHDAVMTPMDVIKQRLQLGYHRGILDCIQTVRQTEGLEAFYRSFPITLFMNIPYGCVMVAVNESIKQTLQPGGEFDTQTYMIAGSGAGAVAAFSTTPLDVVKTRLQTQAAPAVVYYHHPSHQSGSEGAKAGPRRGFSWAKQFWGGSGQGQGMSQGGIVLQGTAMHSAATRCTKGHCGAEQPQVVLRYQGLLDAVSKQQPIGRSIWCG
ncbi:unnamed protein product [Choristocarpus tenellus]